VPTWPTKEFAKLYVDETPISGHTVTSTTGHGGTTPYSIDIPNATTTVNLTAPDPYIAGGGGIRGGAGGKMKYTFYQWRITGPGIAVAPAPAKIDTNQTINISIDQKGNYYAIADFTAQPQAHEVVCKELSPSPASGGVPLIVDFTATIEDNLYKKSGYNPIHEIKTYYWDFGDGTPIRTTSGLNANKTTYTYTTKGKYTPKVRGSTGEDIPSSNCPVTATVKSSSWSKSDWVEIAP